MSLAILECIYNRGLLLWRQGKLTDQALLAVLRDASAQRARLCEASYLVGLVHLERGDSQGAVKVLESVCADGAASLEANTALEQARRLARTSAAMRTFEGHTQGVHSVALSADGRWALSGSYDNTLRLWEVASGRCVRTFEGHTNGCELGGALGRWPLGVVGKRG